MKRERVNDCLSVVLISSFFQFQIQFDLSIFQGHSSSDRKLPFNISHIPIMNVGIAQGERNPNSSWLNSRGVWLTYIILLFTLHLILLSIPYITTSVAWTLTTSIHNLVCLQLKDER